MHSRWEAGLEVSACPHPRPYSPRSLCPPHTMTEKAIQSTPAAFHTPRSWKGSVSPPHRVPGRQHRTDIPWQAASRVLPPCPSFLRLTAGDTRTTGGSCSHTALSCPLQEVIAQPLTSTWQHNAIISLELLGSTLRLPGFLGHCASTFFQIMKDLCLWRHAYTHQILVV